MKRKSLDLSQSIFLLAVGAILGSVFTFGMQKWNAPVSREECQVYDTVFLSHKRIMQGGRVKEIAINCDEGNRFFVDGCCISGELENDLALLESLQAVQIITRPNSRTVLEFSVGDHVILKFGDAIERLSDEASGFFILGIVAYIGSFVGLFNVLRILYEKWNHGG